MYSGQFGRYSYNDLVKALEADIKHANTLAGEIPRSKSGELVQMKLIYSPMAPLIMFLLKWMDNCTCDCLHSRYIKLFHILIYKVYSGRRPRISTFGRKATLRDFYAVILPSLERLHDDLENNCECGGKSPAKKKAKGDGRRFSNIYLEREDECGICLESCTKMVLPNCYHEMCIKCYRDWNMKSESCPFCRGSLKRVKSEDLWVLMCEDDVVDPDSVSKQDLKSFYLYLNTLPQDCPEAIFLLYYEYLF